MPNSIRVIFAVGLLACAPLYTTASDDFIVRYMRAIQPVESAYQSFHLRGRSVEVSFVGAKKTDEFRFEYFGLGDRQRLVLTPIGDEEKKGTAIFVADPEISFAVQRHADGREEVMFLSPRRGFGFDTTTQTISHKAAFLVRQLFCFYVHPLSKLMRDKQLIVSQVSETDVSGTPLVTAKVELSLPNEQSRPDHFTGTIVVNKERMWCLEEMHLTGIAKNDTATHRLDIEVRYKPGSESVPIMDEAQLTHSTPTGEPLVRVTLIVDEIEFGSVTKEDFTLKACGIHTIDTSGNLSSLPLLFWYSLTVLVFCLASLWLVRRYRRRTQGRPL